MDRNELKAKIEAVPKAGFAQLPTPLEELPRIRKALGGPRIFIKRDDCTGLAIGGNKTRQFNFGIGYAVAEGCDSIVTGAASQSNHCRQAAAACSKLGLECHLVLRNDAKRHPVQGNLLLMQLLGARIRFADVELGPELDREKEKLAKELEAQGKKPFILASKRGNGPNATGYVGMVVELEEQLEARGVKATKLYIASAGPTGAGIRLGQKALKVSWTSTFIAPIVWPFSMPEYMANLAGLASDYLGLPERVEASEVNVISDYVGPKYGAFTRAGKEAIELMARTEGILLDPVYSGKAFGALMDHIRRGIVTQDDVVVFVHTGGTPALFAYASDLTGST